MLVSAYAHTRTAHSHHIRTLLNAGLQILSKSLGTIDIPQMTGDDGKCSGVVRVWRGESGRVKWSVRVRRVSIMCVCERINVRMLTHYLSVYVVCTDGVTWILSSIVLSDTAIPGGAIQPVPGTGITVTL